MSFTQQQLEDAYNQMVAERQQDADFAQKAASKLGQRLSKPDCVQWRPAGAEGMWRSFLPNISPFRTEYVLVIELCQYDDWHGWCQALQSAGVVMQPWNNTYTPGPTGELDLSGDPDFAGRSSAKYAVRIDYYDSHAGGF